NARTRQLGVKLTVYNFGSFFRFALNENLSFVHQPLDMDLFNAGMVARGVYVAEGGTCFLSTAHTQADVDRVLDVALETVHELQEFGFMSPVGGAASTPAQGS